MRSLGWIGAEENIQHMASAGEGNMNRTVRVTLASRSIVLKQSVPFVAKYPDIAAPIERIGIEADFYRAIDDAPALSACTPAVQGFDPANHLLCLEDLGTSRDFTDLYDQNPKDDDGKRLMVNIVSWLSNLHDLQNLEKLLPQGLDNRAMRELNHTHIFEIPLTPDNGLTLDVGLHPVAEQFAHDEPLRDEARRLGRRYLGREPQVSANVLLHGDFYPGSWLKHPPGEIRIIDPEFAFIGPPEFDVGVLIGHLTLCGYNLSERTLLLESYDPPNGFSLALAHAFAGIEVIRRLLGVAQLPLSASAETKVSWLQAARQLVLG